MNRTHPSARATLLAFAALALTTSARAQLDASDPFIKDASAGFAARTFFMDSVDNSSAPAQTIKEAWAIGGRLFGRTGYWNKTLQFGATYYLSAPLYAPADKDGTLLLGPGQSTISTLGELFARLKFGDHQLTLGRQEIDMSAPRAAGVRANRSDGTYVGRQDNRMLPVSYEAALLGGRFGDSLRYHAGWIDKAKPRNAEDFTPVGSVVGATGSGSEMWMAGLQSAPVQDLWLQGWYHYVKDVIRIGFLDADYVMRLPGDSRLRLAGQYTDQRSHGTNALTGSAFSTHNAQLYGEYGSGWITLYGVWSRTGTGASLRTPFSSGPIYTAQIVRSFVNAGEKALQLGVSADLAAWAPGVTAYFDATSGTGAVNASSGLPLRDEVEYNTGVVWTLRQKGSLLDGLRSRARLGWVHDETADGQNRSTDFRIDLNLPINFL